MFEPKKVVALAKPGQVSGYGRLIGKALDPHYAEAAKIAHDNPGKPVVVHEWPLPEKRDGMGASGVREYENNLDELKQYVHAERKAALRQLNEADQRGELGLGDADAVEGVERFQVSSTLSEPDRVIRSWIAFHPEGRPIRRRRRGDGTGGEAAAVGAGNEGTGTSGGDEPDAESGLVEPGPGSEPGGGHEEVTE
jgi:hypothetical protein